MEKSIYTQQYELMLEILRNARKTAGISQAELALRLDLTQSKVSKCEVGERRLDFIEVREWCRAIGLPLTTLLDEIEVGISRLEAMKASLRKPAKKRTRKAQQ